MNKYKYKQTTEVEIGDLVVWTDISKYHDTLTKDKVYQVTNHPDQNTLNVINDKGNKNSYGKGFGFKVLQTKPADQAVVGDYMYRISSGTSQFPQHSVIKITKIVQFGLDYSDVHGVGFKEVIVIAQAEPLNLYSEIPLGATAECSLQPTIKEQPMTFQDFINSLFTEEIKTDYEKKPNFLVTIYNSEGTEIAVTTATSVKSVEDTLQATPKLWGSKAVMYSIDSEVQVSVPVVTTKFKKPKEEK